MKILVKNLRSKIPGYSRQIQFNIILEAEDTNISKSMYGEEIKMVSKTFSYHFKENLDLPHCDLLAYVALNLLSPYIKSKKLNIMEGVSEKFSL